MRQAGYDIDPGRIRYERIITPADWDTRYEIHRGATFNLAHTLDQMLHLRPHNRFEDLDGMYLVGGGTHPGSGLPVIFESARISSRLLLEDLGVNGSRPVVSAGRSAVLPSPNSTAVPGAAQNLAGLLPSQSGSILPEDLSQTTNEP